MYCKHCGEKYQNEKAVICLKCGTSKEQGNSFCKECGTVKNPNTNVCMNCGCSTVSASDQKSKLIAGLLGIFVGGLGIHNFYIGNTNRATVQLSVTIGCSLLVLCTLGISLIGPLAMSIWGFVEGIQILTGSIVVDAKGVPFKD